MPYFVDMIRKTRLQVEKLVIDYMQALDINYLLRKHLFDSSYIA